MSNYIEFEHVSKTKRSTSKPTEDIPMTLVVENIQELALSKEAAAINFEESSSGVTKPTSILRARSKYEEDALAQRPEVCSPHVRKGGSSRRLVWPTDDEQLVAVREITPRASRNVRLPAVEVEDVQKLIEDMEETAEFTPIVVKPRTPEEQEELDRKYRESEEAIKKYLDELYCPNVNPRRPNYFPVLNDYDIMAQHIEYKYSFWQKVIFYIQDLSDIVLGERISVLDAILFGVLFLLFTVTLCLLWSYTVENLF